MLAHFEGILLRGGTVTRRVYEGHAYYYITEPGGFTTYNITYNQFVDLVSSLGLVKLFEDRHARVQRFGVGGRAA